MTGKDALLRFRELPMRSQGLLAIAVLSLVWLAARSLVRRYEIAAAKSRLGCLPPPRLRQSERVVGLGALLESLRAARSNRFLELVQRRFDATGTTVSASFMFQNFVSTIEPENVRALLSSQFADFAVAAPRETAFAPLTGRGGVFTSDGHAWQHSRALLRPCFSRDQISDLVALETHVTNFFRHLPADGASMVDIQPLFFRLTLDNSTEFLFGESVNSLLDHDPNGAHAFAEAFDYAQAQMFNRFRMGPLLPLYRNRKFYKSCEVARSFVDRFVQIALHRRAALKESGKESQGGRYVFLDELTRETQDPDFIRTSVLNLLIAGRDTTAAMLSNTFYFLSQRPDVWEKLRGEVSKLGGAHPTYEDIKDLKYIRYILNETLRLYPSIPVNARFAVKDTSLPTGGGPDGKSPVFIAKGEGVTYFVGSMHRRKDIFGADAEEFRPERWETLRPHWGFLPFNGGPRICLGQQFAMTNASYVVARLAQSYSAISYRGEPYEENLSLSLTNLDGVKVVLKLDPQAS